MKTNINRWCISEAIKNVRVAFHSAMVCLLTPLRFIYTQKQVAFLLNIYWNCHCHRVTDLGGVIFSRRIFSSETSGSNSLSLLLLLHNMPVVSLAKIAASPAVTAGDFTAPCIYGKRLVSNRVSFGNSRRRSFVSHRVRSELQSPRVLGSVTGFRKSDVWFSC